MSKDQKLHDEINFLRQRLSDLEGKSNENGEGNDAASSLLQQHIITTNGENSSSLENERLRFFSNHASEWFWETDHDLRYTSFSTGYETIRGESSHELIGKTHAEALGQFANHETQQNFIQLTKKHTTISQMNLCRAYPDGQNLWAEVSCEPRFEEGGKFIGYFGVARDISNRMNAITAFEESEQRIFEVINSVPAMIANIDANERFRFANSAYSHLFGFKPEDLIGEQLKNVIGDNLYDKSVMRRASVLSGIEQHYEEEITGKDGQTTYVQTALIPQTRANGLIVGYIVQIQDITERKRAEIYQRVSDERYARIFDIPLIGIAIYSTESKEWLSINTAFCEMMGYSETELTGVTWVDLTHPDDLQKNLELYSWAVSGEGDASYTMDKRYIRKDGSIIHTTIFVQIVTETETGSSYNILLVQDISKREQAEQLLRESRDELEIRVVERTKELEFQKLAVDEHSIVSIADINGNITYANDKFCEISGYTREEIIGENHRILFSGEHPKAFFIEMWKSISMGIPWHGNIKNIKKNGEYYWVNTTIIPDIDVNGKPSQYIGIRTDITSRIEGENILVESEEKFRKFYDLTPDMFTIIELKTGIFVEVNDAFERLTGYTREEAIGQSSLELNIWDDNDARDLLVSELNSRGFVEEYPTIQRRKDGSTWQAIISVVMISLGGEEYIFGSTRDVTDIRKTQQEAISANIAKSEFLASMSHELRTPLTSSIGSLGLLNAIEANTLSDQGLELLEIATRNNKTLLRLVNELLDFEKILSGELEFETTRHDIGEITSQVIKDNHGYGQTHQVNFVFIEPEEHLFASVQEHRLAQVLSNLLSNAAKFSTSGSDVEISVNRLNQNVVVSIQDYGAGIPEDFKTKIFDKFTQADSSSTREYGGTGLGLSISKALIEGMGGTVKFESEFGKGTTFMVSFPEVKSGV